MKAAHWLRPGRGTRTDSCVHRHLPQTIMRVYTEVKFLNRLQILAFVLVTTLLADIFASIFFIPQQYIRDRLVVSVFFN